MSITVRHGERVSAIDKALTEEIVAGVLPAGHRLSESRLAERFSVSRGPVREALSRLQQRGLITVTPNAGARVITLGAADIVDLYLAREALEGMAARLAAERMTDDERSQLIRLLDIHEHELNHQVDGIYQQSSGDWDFHFTISRCARNPVIERTLNDELYQRLRLCRHQHVWVKGRGRRALVEHHRIVDAIVEGDGEAAEFQMRRHIAASRRALEQAYAEHARTSGRQEVTV